jgi:hypothetical protein
MEENTQKLNNTTCSVLNAAAMSLNSNCRRIHSRIDKKDFFRFNPNPSKTRGRLVEPVTVKINQ